MQHPNIRFMNTLAAALFDRDLINVYDLTFQQYKRPFNCTAHANGMSVVLINVGTANQFVNLLTDLMPAQLMDWAGQICGYVLSMQPDSTIYQTYADSEAVFANEKGIKYNLPYAVFVSCGVGRFTACIVTATTGDLVELIDQLVDDAEYLASAYKLPLPHGYLPAHISGDLGDDEIAPDTTDQVDINKLVNDAIANAVSANLDDLSTEQMMQVTMDAMSNVATRNSQQKPIRAYGESEIRDEAARRDIDFAGLGIIDESNLNIASFNGISSFGSEPALSNTPTATLMGIYTADAEQLDNPQVVIDAEGNRVIAEVTPAEDFEAYEPYTADAEDFEQLADTASELTPEDTIHVLTQTVALITGEGVTANVYNQIRGFLESCRDRWVKSEPSLLRILVTDFYGTMDNTDVHGIHTGDFVVFNKAEPTETLRSGYHLDLRGIDSLGVYRCTLADTDMRTEWFVAKITPENYIDVMRVMFPRQYSGITIKYVQDFFESLLNEPTQPVEDFTLDNGYYDVRMLAQIDNLDIWLLARVECNFPVVQVVEPTTDDAPAA